METFALTHPGYKRKHNEDHSFIKEFSDNKCLLAVADGMGGHVGGEMASRLAIDVVKDDDLSVQDIESHLGDIIRTGHSNILETVKKKPELRGMGTTLSIAYIKDGIVHWAHVGDTRLYLFHNEKLFLITKDHTIPGVLMEKKKITAEQARKHPMRHMLLRCVGCKDCEPETGSFRVEPGDTVILCSDGLYDEVSPDVMISILQKEQTSEQKLETLIDTALQYGEIPPEAIISILKTHQTLKQKIHMLVNAALKAGGSDNITIVGAEI
ncbi:PP2C family protein-serine/threonine phosphatase [Desulfonema magnum]|uniref:Protein phosphatase domain-containing protein n=1 Tax=Desulfonema magnum TaxID=45655 RepID=A0A975BU96_9BACT|nr:protein phosphatase 2C domain-containing protein [Desulfonema magnum]QTA91849.1 Protein phosphatase domain-containing protein [Desulfonema magnum]